MKGLGLLSLLHQNSDIIHILTFAAIAASNPQKKFPIPKKVLEKRVLFGENPLKYNGLHWEMPPYVAFAFYNHELFDVF